MGGSECSSLDLAASSIDKLTLEVANAIENERRNLANIMKFKKEFLIFVGKRQADKVIEVTETGESDLSLKEVNRRLSEENQGLKTELQKTKKRNDVLKELHQSKQNLMELRREGSTPPPPPSIIKEQPPLHRFSSKPVDNRRMSVQLSTSKSADFEEKKDRRKSVSFNTPPTGTNSLRGILRRSSSKSLTNQETDSMTIALLSFHNYAKQMIVCALRSELFHSPNIKEELDTLFKTIEQGLVITKIELNISVSAPFLQVRFNDGMESPVRLKIMLLDSDDKDQMKNWWSITHFVSKYPAYADYREK